MKYNTIYICRFCFKDYGTQWLLTTNPDYALTFQSQFQLASLADLHDWVAATGETFNGILSVTEGLCKWNEREYIDEYGETDVEYSYVIVCDRGV